MTRAVQFTAALVLAAFGSTAPAVADEAKSSLSASMILGIMSQPRESREVAFDEALKSGPLPPQGPVMEVLPDGSVRYGDVTMTVKNPCPPGTEHYEPPPLPGRRARR
jgi:hypothetical protein